MWLDPRVSIGSNLEVRGSRHRRPDRKDPASLERFPLRGNKARSLQSFAAVCRMIEQGNHLQLDGLREIVDIATEINLGKRRYSPPRAAVTMRSVRTISRKDSVSARLRNRVTKLTQRILRDYTPSRSLGTRERMR